jgi:hypothetical protein
MEIQRRKSFAQDCILTLYSNTYTNKIPSQGKLILAATIVDQLKERRMQKKKIPPKGTELQTVKSAENVSMTLLPVPSDTQISNITTSANIWKEGVLAFSVKNSLPSEKVGFQVKGTCCCTKLFRKLHAILVVTTGMF